MGRGATMRPGSTGTTRPLSLLNPSLCRVTNGAELSGRLLEISDETATLIAADGQVIPVLRAQVDAVWVTNPAPEPAQRGRNRGESLSRRRGLYVVGSGGFSMALAADRYVGVSEPYDGTTSVSSPGFVAGIALGGTLRPGMVLGVALDATAGSARYSDRYTSSSAADGEHSFTGRGTAIGGSLFLQQYIQDLYIRGGVGGLGLVAIEPSAGEVESTGGMGFDVGIGFHHRVTDKVAIGASIGLRAAFWRYDNSDYRGRLRVLAPMARVDVVRF